MAGWGNIPIFRPYGGGSGTSGTGKNYFTINSANPNFSSGATSPWSVFNTSFGSDGVPTTITLSATQVTFAATSTNPLLISQSSFNGQVVKSAANAQGQGIISSAMTIDREDLAKVLYGSFSYEVVSGTVDFSGTSTQTLEIWVYNVTAAAWIQASGYRGMNQSSGEGKVVFNFQTDSTAANNQYRVAIIYRQTDTNASTINFNDFSLGPQSLVLGSPITDLVSYTLTPSAGFGTTTNNVAYWKRIGDCIYVEGSFTSGTVAGSIASINLPSGFSIDSNKIGLSTTTAAASPLAGEWVGNGSGNQAGPILMSLSTSTTVLYFGEYSLSNPNVPKNGNSIIGNATVVGFKFIVPITGFSSNVQMSSDTDTRIVAAILSGDPASATSGNPIIVPTIGYDSHGAYNSTTGRYTVPISGIYKMYGALQSASSATTLTIYKNAASTSLAGNLDSNGEATFCSSVQCNAGDIIDIRPGGTVDATNMTLNIERLSGPSVVLNTESVNARYFSSSTSISGSDTTIVYGTKDFDSHNAYSSGTYTVPVSGKYQVNAAIAAAGTFALNNTTIIKIFKNGSEVSNVDRFAGGVITNGDANISDIIACNAGDTIQIKVSCGATTPSIVSSNTRNYVSIARVGN